MRRSERVIARPFVARSERLALGGLTKRLGRLARQCLRASLRRPFQRLGFLRDPFFPVSGDRLHGFHAMVDRRLAGGNRGIRPCRCGGDRDAISRRSFSRRCLGGGRPSRNWVSMGGNARGGSAAKRRCDGASRLLERTRRPSSPRSS